MMGFLLISDSDRILVKGYPQFVSDLVTRFLQLEKLRGIKKLHIP